MSMSESVSEEKKNDIIYFHGENIYSKKFQKRLHKKASLTRAILINTAIIVVFILIVWICIMLSG
ncbi:MAG: hypothetical protein ACFE78_13160 [Candidatus Hodarchaeota archaeon]